MGKIIIEAKGLVKTYQNGKGRLVVLDNINIQIRENSIISIIGESGAGKSTLLNVLSSLDVFDKGELNIEGSNIKSFSEKQLCSTRNSSIGFIFQFHHLLPDFNVRENILMPAWINKDYEKDKKVDELLKNFGLLKISHKYPNEISGGEKQRVAILRSIINDPKVLFADEPSGNLDEKNSMKLIDLFESINRSLGTSIVLTTHNPHIANMGSDKYELKSKTLFKR
ncbi:ABC transporter ATP-binding protein [Candidatus Marinimicrobia bacterium]|nr:ABC transporter ATP-binding protein [Candidatus Neomarinimicrobiota bacterium]